MKKLYSISVILFCSIFFLTACKPKICNNKKDLFIISSDVKMISMDSLVSLKSTINYLESISCTNGETAIPIIYFDTKKSKIIDETNSNSIAIGIEPPPCGDLSFEYDFDKILEINLDGNNILIEGKQKPLDSIAQYVYNQYLNYGKDKGFSEMPDGNGIWLITKMSRPITDFEPIIAQLIKGFNQTSEAFCEAIFDKKLCELSDKEYIKFKNRMQFHLAFKYSDEVKPLIISG